MANLSEESIWVFNLKTKEGITLSGDANVRWADSFSEDAKGNIYFTTSQINYPIDEREKYKIYKLIYVNNR